MRLLGCVLFYAFISACAAPTTPPPAPQAARTAVVAACVYELAAGHFGSNCEATTPYEWAAVVRQRQAESDQAAKKAVVANEGAIGAAAEGAMNAWMACLGSVAAKFAISTNEPADTVATATFGACAVSERVAAKAGIAGSSDSADDAAEYIRHIVRPRLLAVILAVREAGATAHPPPVAPTPAPPKKDNEI